MDESHDYFEDYEEENKHWKWKQFHSIVLGPCYMFEFTTNVSTNGPYATLGIKYGRETLIGKVQFFLSGKNKYIVVQIVSAHGQILLYIILYNM